MKMVEGLRTELQWKIDREEEIAEAIARYHEAGLEIPNQWFEELVKLQLARPEVMHASVTAVRNGIIEKLKEED
jgi:hypothetical protein